MGLDAGVVFIPSELQSCRSSGARRKKGVCSSGLQRCYPYEILVSFASFASFAF